MLQRRFQLLSTLFFKSVQNSVDTSWHPLTPEHGFPSLKYKTQGAPPQSATIVVPKSSFRKEKQEIPLVVPPVKTLSYDFLRRHYPHQVIGSKLDNFLSAC